jgi:hypothetical protein
LIVVLADTMQIYSFQQAGNKWYAEQQLVLNKPGAYLKAYSGDYSGDGLGIKPTICQRIPSLYFSPFLQYICPDQRTTAIDAISISI